MEEFNYRRAWQELIVPAYNALPPTIMTILGLVRRLSPPRRQDKKRAVRLQALLVAVPDDLLRRSAAVIYAHGHWGPADAGKDDVYWRFERLGKAELLRRGSAFIEIDWDTSRFMEHKSGTDYDDAEVSKWATTLVPDVTGLERRAVNFRVINPSDGQPDQGVRGHPFVIGAKHFPGADEGLYLKPDKAPCALRKCGRPYAWHQHDLVLVVTPRCNLTQSEARASLQRLRDAQKAHNAANPEDLIRFDGFAFAETEFTIAPSTPA